MSLTVGVGIAPFSFVGPKRVDDHFELRIAELPDFFIGAETVEEIYADLRDALNEYLQSLRDHGQPLPPFRQDGWVLLSPMPAPKETEQALGRPANPEVAPSGASNEVLGYTPTGLVAAA